MKLSGCEDTRWLHRRYAPASDRLRAESVIDISGISDRLRLESVIDITGIRKYLEMQLIRGKNRELAEKILGMLRRDYDDDPSPILQEISKLLKANPVEGGK